MLSAAGWRSFATFRTVVCGDEDDDGHQVSECVIGAQKPKGAQQRAPFLCFEYRGTVVEPWHKDVERVVLDVG